MNILQKVFGTKSEVKMDHRQSFTKEEQDEIFDSAHAAAIARGIINDPRYQDLVSAEAMDWYERAGFCLSQINFKFYWQHLQYGLFALDRFIILSRGANGPLAKTASSLMGDLVKEWRVWKTLSRAAGVSLDTNAMSQIYLKQGTMLLKLGYCDKAIPLFDRIINMPIRGGEYVEEAKLMKASCLLKMGRS